MLSPMKMREVARDLEQARKILIAKVVVSMRYDPGHKSAMAQLTHLQQQFEGLVRGLPLWLRSERFLTKHVLEPAERRLKREGVLALAQQMREWEL